jgi:hypothetical protein
MVDIQNGSKVDDYLPVCMFGGVVFSPVVTFVTGKHLHQLEVDI